MFLSNFYLFDTPIIEQKYHQLRIVPINVDHVIYPPAQAAWRIVPEPPYVIHPRFKQDDAYKEATEQCSTDISSRMDYTALSDTEVEADKFFGRNSNFYVTCSPYWVDLPPFYQSQLEHEAALGINNVNINNEHADINNEHAGWDAHDPDEEQAFQQELLQDDEELHIIDKMPTDDEINNLHTEDIKRELSYSSRFTKIPKCCISIFTPDDQIVFSGSKKWGSGLIGGMLSLRIISALKEVVAKGDKNDKDLTLAKSIFNTEIRGQKPGRECFFHHKIEPTSVLFREGIASHKYIVENPYISTEDEYLRFLMVMKSSFNTLFAVIVSKKAHIQRFISYSREFKAGSRFKVASPDYDVMGYIEKYATLLIDIVKGDIENVNIHGASPKNYIKGAKHVLTLVSAFQGYKLNAGNICKDAKFNADLDMKIKEFVRSDHGTFTASNRCVDNKLLPKEEQALETALFSETFMKLFKEDYYGTMKAQTWVICLKISGLRGFSMAEMPIACLYPSPLPVLELGEAYTSTPCCLAGNLVFGKTSDSKAPHLVMADHKLVCWDASVAITCLLSMMCRRSMVPGNDKGLFYYIADELNGLTEQEKPPLKSDLRDWWALHLFAQHGNAKKNCRDHIKKWFTELLNMADIRNKKSRDYLFRNTNVHHNMLLDIPVAAIKQAMGHVAFKEAIHDYYGKGSASATTFINAMQGDRFKYCTLYDFLINVYDEKFGVQPLYEKAQCVPYTCKEDFVEWEAVDIPEHIMDAVLPGLIACNKARQRLWDKHSYRDPRLENLLKCLVYKCIPNFFARLDEIYIFDSNCDIVGTRYFLAAMPELEAKCFHTDTMKAFIKTVVAAKRRHVVKAQLIRDARFNKADILRAKFQQAAAGGFVAPPAPSSAGPSQPSEAAESSDVAAAKKRCLEFNFPLPKFTDTSEDLLPLFNTGATPGMIFRYWDMEPEEGSGKISLRDYDNKYGRKSWKKLLYDFEMKTEAGKEAISTNYSNIKHACVWLDGIDPAVVSDKSSYIDGLFGLIGTSSNQVFFNILRGIIPNKEGGVRNLKSYKNQTYGRFFLKIYHVVSKGDFVFHNLSDAALAEFKKGGKEMEDYFAGMSADKAAKRRLALEAAVPTPSCTEGAGESGSVLTAPPSASVPSAAPQASVPSAAPQASVPSAAQAAAPPTTATPSASVHVASASVPSLPMSAKVAAIADLIVGNWTSNELLSLHNYLGEYLGQNN